MERYNLILLSGAVAFAGAMFYVATSPGRES